MLTLWSNPEAAFAAFDQLVNDVARPTSNGWNGYGLTPAADIVESEAGFRVVLDMPGLDAKEIKIQVENDTLSVQAERKFAEPAKGENAHRSERAAGTFHRSFSLPTTVDGGKVEAKYENGVLTVVLPKREEAKPRTIQVSVK